jgi:hypothetical protein
LLLLQQTSFSAYLLLILFKALHKTT